MKFDEMTKEELVNYINNLNEELNGKYGLVWDKEKEPEKIVVDCDKYIPVINEFVDKKIENSGENNILLEGDNFHSLSVLNYTHKESIDVIYIDPPYNTGNKDFMYNDKYVDPEDGYRHSKWMNFIEKRLKIARNLLKDDGMIFISIDDNEQAQLKILCDKIFDSHNFISQFVWEKAVGPKNLAKFISTNHEYILMYAKNINYLKIEGDAKSERALKDYKNKDNDPRGLWSRTSMLAPKYSRSGDFVMTFNNGKKYTLSAGTSWRYTKEKMLELEKDNRISFEPNMPRKKTFLSESKNTPPKSLLLHDLVGTNQDGSAEIVRIFQDKSIFDYPKPVKLIKYLISKCTNRNAIILDFFAGSGTTGQAVLELNKEDNGNRKFILCTNNENGICEKITYNRIKTVITGLREDGSLYSEGLNGTLKYYKTDFIENIGTRDQLYYDLTEKCIPMLCIKSNTYELVEKNKEYAIYSNLDKTRYSCVYFDIFGESYDKFINKVKEINSHKNLYIFSLSEYINEDNFKGITNYTIEPIPYKILDLYKSVVKMSKEN